MRVSTLIAVYAAAASALIPPSNSARVSPSSPPGPSLLSTSATATAPLLSTSSRGPLRSPSSSRAPVSSLLMAAAAQSSSPSAAGVSTAWGVFGFLSILASAVRRLLPIALQPLSRRDLSFLQWACYGRTVATFAYVEGYRAFQTKFSPMVVRRAMTLGDADRPIAHKALAPFYSMGLFHATKKRRTVSWSVSCGVFMLVGIVKRLPYPWRAIVDAGVCTGLCWGGASILALYARALAGTPPEIDPELP